MPTRIAPRLFLVTALLVIGVAACNGAVAQPAESPRSQLDLTGPWLFWPDKKDEGTRLGFWGDSFNADGWRRVAVPIAFDHCGLDLDRYSGIGWYRRTVHVPAEMKDRRVVLHFEGISYNAVVWVNGQKVGENHDAFLPFDLNVGGVLRYGQENVIVVRIDNLRQKFQFPLFEGWFGQGGFLREASLVATDLVHLDRIETVARPEEAGGHLRWKATVRNEQQQPVSVTVRVSVTDSAAKPVGVLTSEPLELAPGKEGQSQVESRVPNVVPWSPDRPTLYLAQAELLVNGQVVDRLATRFGFRSVEAKNGQILLNGKPIFLLGFNRHEDSPSTGMAVDLAQAKADFQEIKRMGGNFVRLCHYPHHPGELDLCDELGLLVMIENAMNEWGHLDHGDPNGGYVPKPEEAPKVVENGKRTLVQMVRRDANHPSVILCSVGNESAEERADVVEGNSELIEFGKKLDPTRLWTHVSNSYRKPEYRPAFYRSDDVIVINAYPCHWLGSNEAAVAQATPWFQEKAAMLHRDHPGKPIMIGECGWPMDGNDDFQRRVVETEFRAASAAPYMAGVTFWCYAHHPWPTGISPYGYVTRDRKTKYAAAVTIESLFREKSAKPHATP